MCGLLCEREKNYSREGVDQRQFLLLLLSYFFMAVPSSSSSPSASSMTERREERERYLFGNIRFPGFVLISSETYSFSVADHAAHLHSTRSERKI